MKTLLFIRHDNKTLIINTGIGNKCQKGFIPKTVRAPVNTTREVGKTIQLGLNLLKLT